MCIVTSTHLTVPYLLVHGNTVSIIPLFSWHCWLAGPGSLPLQVCFSFLSSRPLSNAGKTDWSHHLWLGPSESWSQIITRANLLHCPQAPTLSLEDISLAPRGTSQSDTSSTKLRCHLYAVVSPYLTHWVPDSAWLLLFCSQQGIHPLRHASEP